MRRFARCALWTFDLRVYLAVGAIGNNNSMNEMIEAKEAKNHDIDRKQDRIKNVRYEYLFFGSLCVFSSLAFSRHPRRLGLGSWRLLHSRSSVGLNDTSSKLIEGSPRHQFTACLLSRYARNFVATVCFAILSSRRSKVLRALSMQIETWRARFMSSVGFHRLILASAKLQQQLDESLSPDSKYPFCSYKLRICLSEISLLRICRRVRGSYFINPSSAQLQTQHLSVSLIPLLAAIHGELVI